MALPTPTATDLPLAGGSDAATVRVHPLRTADMLAPPRFYDRPPGPLGSVRGLLAPKSRFFAVPIPAFLVEHPTAGPILVDAGIHERAATDLRAALGRRGALLYDVQMEASWAVPSRLRARGIDPADVKLVVMTHLHYDHASGLSQLPGATVVVDEREWEAARRGRFLEGYMGHLFPAEVHRWRTVPHADDEIDLLGDGSIVLLRTPGHSPGHRSVLLRVAGGELLLVGDAVYSKRSLDERLLPLFAWRVDVYRSTLERLRVWRDGHPGATMIFGHDAEEWPKLASVY